MSDTVLGRDELLGVLTARLRDRSLILVGPRRVGKTTLLNALADRDSTILDGHVVDLQGLQTVDAFVRATRAAIRPETRVDAVRSAAGRVEEVSVTPVGGLKLSTPAPSDPWADLESTLISALPNDGRLLVVALDELPWWLDAVELAEPGRARATLARLRRGRHDPRLARVRWVFTGSVGLAGRAIDWDAAAELNDLDVVIAPPLDPDAGAALFETECDDCEPEAGRRAHAAAGGLPHWIRVLAERCRTAAAGTRVTTTMVDAELERLLQPAFRHLFQEEGLGHFGRRYTPEDREIAVALLDVLAQAHHPVALRGLVQVAQSDLPGRDRVAIERIFWRLVDEFYVTTDPNDLARIAVPLFQRWWARWGRV